MFKKEIQKIKNKLKKGKILVITGKNSLQNLEQRDFLIFS